MYICKQIYILFLVGSLDAMTDDLSGFTFGLSIVPCLLLADKEALERQSFGSVSFYHARSIPCTNTLLPAARAPNKKEKKRNTRKNNNKKGILETPAGAYGVVGAGVPTAS